jgi:4-amino-4-deoxy-L-arabinose transferase-like glycosyltransferase
MFKKALNLKLVFILILVSLVSGYFWNHKIFSQPLIGGDEIDYDQAALDILVSQRFTQPYEGVTVEPLYFFFLSGIYKIFGHNYDAIRWIQIIFFVLICLFVYFLAKEIFDDKIAFFSGLCLALFYPLASCAGRLWREILFTLLLVLFIYFWNKAWFSQKKKWFIFSGIILSLAILTNAVIFLLPLFFIINFLIIQKKKLFNKKILTNFLLFIFVILIIFSFSALWNTPSDDFVSSISTTKAGVTLLSRAELMEGLKGEGAYHFLGQTMGYFFVQKLDSQVVPAQVFGVPPDSVANRPKDLSKAGYSPQEIDKIFLKEALIKILKKPHLYLFSSFLNLISYNNPMLFNPQTLLVFRIQNLFVDTHPELTDFTKASIILTIRLIWLMFFFFVIYGAIKAVRKNWSRFGWLILIILYFNLIYSLLFAIPRYALPIWPFYIILFVYGLSFFWSKFKLKKSDTY